MPEAILSHIRSKLKEQVEDVLRRAKRVRDRDIEKAKKELEDWIDERNRKMVREKIRAISQKRASAMRQLRLEKEVAYEQMWIDFVSNLKNALTQSYRDEHYVRLIFSIVCRVKKEYGVSKVRLLLNQQDREFFEKDWDKIHGAFSSMLSSCDMELGPSADMSGGVIIEEVDTGRRFVFSFDSVIDANMDVLKEWLRSEISRDL